MAGTYELGISGYQRSLSFQTNNMEKAFLFDINAKFNVAADDSITETKNFHLSTDYIGKMLAFQSLFE